jgi:lipoate-protein ligase A
VPLAPRWRLLVSAPADGATNMAVDHALLDRAASSEEAVLRIYTWVRPTLSLGMHERARLAPEAAAAAGVDVVRRPTGGRALLHHREVTYSVTAPIAGASLGESYRAINALLLAALGRLGVVAAEAERRGRPLRPDGAACFAEPNAGELVVDGRKLVGSAQRRDERAFLQHGSILLADDQALVNRLRGQPDAPPAAATLGEILGRDVNVPEVVAALATALAASSEAPVATLDEAEFGTSLTPHLAHYRDPRWTYRR